MINKKKGEWQQMHNKIASNCIIVDGIKFPPANQGFSVKTTQGVDGGKNGVNAFIGQKVGRRQYKLEGLEWSDLPIEVWQQMREALENFIVQVTFTDDCNKRHTISMYPGDTSATPGYFDEDEGIYTYMEKCSVNLIDCGYEEEMEGD